MVSLPIVVGCADLNLDLSGSSSSKDTSQQSVASKDNGAVTAQHLVDEQADNPLRFETQYLKRRVRVSGKVKEIGKTSVALSTKGGGGVRVDLNDLSATDILPLNVGDRVTADCVVGALTIWGIIPLSDCQMR